MAKEKEKKKKAEPRKVVKKATKQKAKKRWLPIIAPKSFEHAPLGETHVAAPENAVGKSLTANLMNLTGDMRKQGVQIRFDVTKVADGKAQTAVTGYEMLSGALKRAVRRGRSKVADSFVAKTATGRAVRIKPIIITTNRASRGACTAIRLAARERLTELLAAASFDKLVQQLITYDLQRALKDTVGKIHPVKQVEVKACFLVTEGTVAEDTRAEDFVEVQPTPTEEEPAKAESE